MSLCSRDGFCEAMHDVLQFDNQKGIISVSYLNLKTGEDSYSVIGYRPKAGINSKWYGFRVCPFCTQPINHQVFERIEE